MYKFFSFGLGCYLFYSGWNFGIAAELGFEAEDADVLVASLYLGKSENPLNQHYQGGLRQ